MDKKQITEIREICAIRDMDNLSIELPAKTVIALLDAYEKQKSINYEIADDLGKIQSDRDHWKARAEALERAIKRYAPCLTCIYRTDASCIKGCNLRIKNSSINEWQFDETRFAAEEDAAND